MSKQEYKEAMKEVLEENLPAILNKYFTDNNYAFDRKVEKAVRGVLAGVRRPELAGGG